MLSLILIPRLLELVGQLDKPFVKGTDLILHEPFLLLQRLAFGGVFGDGVFEIADFFLSCFAHLFESSHESADFIQFLFQGFDAILRDTMSLLLGL